MFTLKHITQKGEEFLFSTPHTNFVPKAAVDVGPVNVQDTLWWWDQNASTMRSIDEGSVYVMNDNGSTVSIYHLAFPKPSGKGEVPLDNETAAA